MEVNGAQGLNSPVDEPLMQTYLRGAIREALHILLEIRQQVKHAQQPVGHELASIHTWEWLIR